MSKAPVPEAGRAGLAARLAGCLRSGSAAGGKQALWLLAVMVPVSLAVALFAWSGALARIAGWIRPGLGLLGLPGETAVALVTAAALNIYSGIAALGSAPLGGREVTILAFFMLSFHNLPIEVAVQRKAGSSAWQMLALRLAAAAGGALVLNLIAPADIGRSVIRESAAAAPAGLREALWAWSFSSGRLIGKVVVLVVALMILQRLLIEFGLVKWLSQGLRPLLLVLGLPRSTAFLWIAMNTLGLAYGAGVLLEEVQSGRLSRADVELLNRSAAVCHSLLEDTLLFVVIGASAPWIIAPRLALAAAAVWGSRAWRRIAERPAAAP